MRKREVWMAIGALGIALLGSLEVRGMGFSDDTPSTGLQEGGAFEGPLADPKGQQGWDIKSNGAYGAGASAPPKEIVSTSLENGGTQSPTDDSSPQGPLLNTSPSDTPSSNITQKTPMNLIKGNNTPPPSAPILKQDDNPRSATGTFEDRSVEEVEAPSQGPKHGEEEAVPTGNWSRNPPLSDLRGHAIENVSASANDSLSPSTTKLLLRPFLLKEEESKWIGLEQEKEAAETSNERKSDLESQQEELLEGVLSRLVSRITTLSQGEERVQMDKATRQKLQIEEPTLRQGLEPLKRTLRNELQLKAALEGGNSPEELEALRVTLESENQTSSGASSSAYESLPFPQEIPCLGEYHFSKEERKKIADDYRRNPTGVFFEYSVVPKVEQKKGSPLSLEEKRELNRQLARATLLKECQEEIAQSQSGSYLLEELNRLKKDQKDQKVLKEAQEGKARLFEIQKELKEISRLAATWRIKIRALMDSNLLSDLSKLNEAVKQAFELSGENNPPLDLIECLKSEANYWMQSAKKLAENGFTSRYCNLEEAGRVASNARKALEKAYNLSLQENPPLDLIDGLKSEANYWMQYAQEVEKNGLTERNWDLAMAMSTASLALEKAYDLSLQENPPSELIDYLKTTANYWMQAAQERVENDKTKRWRNLVNAASVMRDPVRALEKAYNLSLQDPPPNQLIECLKTEANYQMQSAQEQAENGETERCKNLKNATNTCREAAAVLAQANSLPSNSAESLALVEQHYYLRQKAEVYATQGKIAGDAYTQDAHENERDAVLLK